MGMTHAPLFICTGSTCWNSTCPYQSSYRSIMHCHHTVNNEYHNVYLQESPIKILCMCVHQVVEAHSQLQDLELAMDAKESQVRKLEYEIKLISGELTYLYIIILSIIFFLNNNGGTASEDKYVIIFHFENGRRYSILLHL